MQGIVHSDRLGDVTFPLLHSFLKAIGKNPFPFFF